MRIVKEAEVRKEEILDAAEKLFAAKGFDCIVYTLVVGCYHCIVTTPRNL